MGEKYSFTDKTIIHDGHVLKQIIALRDIPRHNIKVGDIGGYIEGETTLSHDGDCWIGGNAKVYDSSVTDCALVNSEATVKRSTICGYAYVHDYANVIDSAIYDCAEIFGRAEIDNSSIFGHAKIYGRARVEGNSEVYGYAEVFDKAKVCYEATISCNVKIYGSAVASNCSVHDNAHIYGCASIFQTWFDQYGDVRICGVTEIEDGVVSIRKNSAILSEDLTPHNYDREEDT